MDCFRKFAFGSAMILISLLVVGCSGDGRVNIDGTVSLDGKPIENGLIQFVPVDRSTGPEGGGVISKGHFTAKVTPGANVVRVRGSRGTGIMYKPDPDLYPDYEAEKLESVTDEVFHWGNGVEWTVPQHAHGSLDIKLPSAPKKS